MIEVEVKFKTKKILKKKFVTYIPDKREEMKIENKKINENSAINNNGYNGDNEKGINYQLLEEVNKGNKEDMGEKGVKVNGEDSADKKKAKIIELLGQKRNRLKDNVNREIALKMKKCEEKMEKLKKKQLIKLQEIDEEIEQEQRNYFSIIDEQRELKIILGNNK